MIFLKQEIEFLNYIYQNARMGVIGIKELMPCVEETAFKDLLGSELEEYESICNEALKLFIKYNSLEKDVSKMAKIMTYMSIKASKKNNINKYAKMMIEGSNKGIIEINEKLNYYKGVSPKIINLANKLLETEQNNINELKQYL